MYDLDRIAQIIGYVVMFFGAVAALLGMFLGVTALWWKSVQSKVAFENVRDALRDWEANNPQKAEAWRKRQGQA